MGSSEVQLEDDGLGAKEGDVVNEPLDLLKCFDGLK